jgi:hypothetical protein
LPAEGFHLCEDSVYSLVRPESIISDFLRYLRRHGCVPSLNDTYKLTAYCAWGHVIVEVEPLSLGNEYYRGLGSIGKIAKDMGLGSVAVRVYVSDNENGRELCRRMLKAVAMRGGG